MLDSCGCATHNSDKLSQILCADLPIKLNNCFPHLQAAGISTQPPWNISNELEVVTHGLIVDMMKARIPWPIIQDAVKKAGLSVGYQKLVRDCQIIYKKYLAINKSKGRGRTSEKLNLFLKKHYTIVEHNQRNIERRVKSLEGKLIKEKENSNVLKKEVKNLKEINKDIINLEANLEKEIKDMCDENEIISKENTKLVAEKETLKLNIGQIKQTNYYKRLVRKENKLKHEQSKLQEHKITFEEHSHKKAIKENRELKSKIENYSEECDMLAARVEYLEKVEENMKENEIEMEIELDETKEKLGKPKTRTHEGKRGQFTDSLRLLVMELAKEQVSAKRTATVIKTVSRHLFGVEFENNDLPCESSVLNIINDAGSLSTCQVAESLLSNRHNTLHTDGTTRDHSKFIDLEFTTQTGKTFSLGFADIGKENADTVFNTILAMLDMVSDTQDSNEENTKQLMKNISNVMMDGAAVNNSFFLKFSEYRNSLLTDDPQVTELQRFRCMLHSLLGMAREVEKGMRLQQTTLEEQSGKMGMAGLTCFTKWNVDKESAALRAIRASSELLGPRGDQKSGCRSYWLAFMNEHLQKCSHIHGFRSNRFNSPFIQAYGLWYHHKDIINFFDLGSLGNGNLYTKALQADINSMHILSFIRCLALLYAHITAPLEKLLLDNSVPILDLSIYVTALVENLTSRYHDLLKHDSQPFIPDNPPVKDHLYETLYQNITEEIEELCKDILCEAAGNICKVINRQMAAFVEESVVHDGSNEELRTQTKGVPKNNLASENDFGILDYIQKMKPNSKTLHNSNIAMLKVNNPVEWLNKKSLAEKRIIMGNLRTQSSKRVKLYKQLESKAKEQRVDAMKDNMEEKVRKETKRRKMEEKAQEGCEQYGGVCRSAEDVEEMLLDLNTKNKKINALKMQIRFYKRYQEDLKQIDKTNFCFMENNSPASDDVLKERLLNILQSNPPTSIDNGVEHIDDGYEYDIGDFVAVAFEDRWYPGEVMAIDDSSFTVSFFEYCGNTAAQGFKYPRRPEVIDIETRFIIAGNLAIQPIRGGRAWEIDECGAINEDYNKYSDKYF